MNYQPFFARLRTSYNDICEYGSGTFGSDADVVDFSGDFVPLIPLGTPATIEWMLGEQAIASYEGQVYLSSPTLLRIVQADTELTRPARTILATNTKLLAEIIPLHSGEYARVHRPAAAQIVYLSQTHITLRCSDILKENQRLLLGVEVDFLTLHQLALQVQHRILMRRGEALFICEVQHCSNDNLIALSAYSARLEQL